MFILVDGGSIFGTFDAPEAMRRFAVAREDHPGAYLAEVLIPGADPRTAIPGELDRAIDAWNAMTSRVNIHKVKNRERLVKPYRKWKKAIGRRDYLLEQLIPDVEAQPYLWPTIRFPWLLRVSADFNSDKVHAGAYGKSGNGREKLTAFERENRARIAQYEQDNPGWRERTDV